jgi:hypothetical protein
MNWTKFACVAAAIAAIAVASPTIGRAAEPEDAATSAAKSAVRDARDQIMESEKSNEVRHIPPRCESDKADCRVRTEKSEHDREHAKPH